MRFSNLLAAGLLCLGLGIPASQGAPVSLTEGFAYGDATVLTDTNTGGTGWTDSGNVGWRHGFTLANTPSQLQAERSHTWSVPAGYTPVVSDGAVRNDNESTGRQGARVFPNGIDMDAAQTFYISFLIQPDADEAGWVNLGLRSGEGSMTAGSADVAMFQMDGSSHKLKFQSGNGGYVTTDAMTQGSDYLVVARFITSPTVNGDEVAWAFFSSSDDVTSEPDWTSLGNNGNRRTDAELDGVHTNLCLRMNDESLVGSIRVANSYSSVIGSGPSTGAGFPVLDGFNYVNGALENTATADGGSGWYNGWTWSGEPLRDPGTYGASALSAVTKTWSSFTNYSPVFYGYSGAIRSGSGATGQEGSRALAEAIDPDPATDTTLYFSFLLNGDSDDPGWVNLVFRNDTGNTITSSDQSLQIQYDGDDYGIDIQADIGHSSTANTLTRGDDYLVVGRLVLSSSAGGDSVAVAFFDDTEDPGVEPDWTGGAGNVASTSGDLFTDGNTAYPINNITWRMNNESLVGSFRLGLNYPAALGSADESIPTLSEWGMILFTGILFAVGLQRLWHHRVRQRGAVQPA